MTFYSNLAATASRLLRSKGQRVTLRTQPAGTYDPATSRNTLPTPVDTLVFGARLAITDQVLRGTLVQAGDEEMLLEAKAGVVPKLNDKIILADATQFQIVGPVHEINPAGMPVLYQLHLRK